LVGVDVDEPARPAVHQAPRRSRPKFPAKSFLGTMPPVRRAIALLVANPGFARQHELPQGWESLSLPGIPLLKELLEILRSQPNLTTASLLERWRGRDEEKHLNKLAAMLLPLPEEGQAREFRDTLASLAKRSILLEWEALVQKAAREGLNEEEKRRLGQLSKEKAQRDRI